jgi:hypothetical protein
MKIDRILILAVVCLSLYACGGNSDSGASLAQQREAAECVEFGDGTVINYCDFAIIVVTFGGSATPVSVPANSEVIDPDADVFAPFGACRFPFTPVEINATVFECL